MSDARTPEEVYDAEISPLMTQVISLVKRHNIPMVASFYIGDDLACTTALYPAVSDWPAEDSHYAGWHRTVRLVGPPLPSSPLMLTTRNAAGEVTRMEAIL